MPYFIDNFIRQGGSAAIQWAIFQSSIQFQICFILIPSGVSLGMLEFQFIICMVIVTNFLELTLDLTDELQKACYNSSTICEKVGDL